MRNTLPNLFLHACSSVPSRILYTEGSCAEEYTAAVCTWGHPPAKTLLRPLAGKREDYVKNGPGLLGCKVQNIEEYLLHWWYGSVREEIMVVFSDKPN